MTAPATQTQAEPWLMVEAYWAYNEDGSGKGRLYTYMVAPGYEVRPGDQILVEGPQGQPKFLRVETLKPYERQEFKCKPVALRIPKHEWAANEDLRAANKDYLAAVRQAGEDKDAIAALGEGPEAPATYSHHLSFPEWVNEVERMWVEGL